MRNILQAYAKRNPFVGYCQGMNFVLEFILRLKFSEEVWNLTYLTYLLEILGILLVFGSHNWNSFTTGLLFHDDRSDCWRENSSWYDWYCSPRIRPEIQKYRVGYVNFFYPMVGLSFYFNKIKWKRNLISIVMFLKKKIF